jgi:DNA-binding SARP family transcriptional activator
VDFHDLGPLLIEADGVVADVGGRRLESVLARLIADVGNVVSVDALVDAIWGPKAPGRATQSLESLVWRLRKVLEPGRVARQEATLIRRSPTGYLLATAARHVDSHRLRTAASTVPGLLEEGDARQALAVADDALSDWRGRPYDGVPEAAWMAAVRAQLDELRMTLQEQRAQALLDVDQPERAVADIVALLRDEPFRERLWTQQMLGLYRCGRQSEALATFTRARRILVDELGIEPGPELRAMRDRILQQDGRLDRSHKTADTAAANLRLPSRRAEIVGRSDDLDRVQTTLNPPTLVTVTGPGGVGKTRLAIELAWLARASFPDGVWFIPFAEITDPALVWPAVAATLGLAPRHSVPVPDLVTQHLATRRGLLILDNCEQVVRGAADVADRILETCSAVALLATSREPLEVTGENVVPIAPLALPRSQPAAPDEPATSPIDSPAVVLFLRRLGDLRPDIDLNGDRLEVITRICAAVGGLPLGIELAAARARTFELHEIADALERDPSTLGRSSSGPDRHSSLHATVEWSYRLARPEEQLLHRRLSILNGPFTLEAAAGLCRLAPLQPEHAMELVAGLAHRSLLTPTGPPRRGGPSRFTQLVPIRAHARAAQPDQPVETLDAVERTLNSWTIEHVLAGPSIGQPGQSAWYDWLDDNAAAVRACLESCLAHRPRHDGLRLVDALIVYWHDRNGLIEGTRWARQTLDLPHLDPYDQAWATCLYGCAAALGDEPKHSRAHLTTALPLITRPPAERRTDSARLLVLVAASAWTADLHDLALNTATAATRLCDEPHVLLPAKAMIAASHLLTGDPTRALDEATAVLDANREADNHFAAMFACITHGVAALLRADPDAGLHWSAETLRHQRALGVRNIGDSLEQRGSHFHTAARPQAALRCYAAAASMQERTGRSWPRHPGTRLRLMTIQSTLDPADYRRSWASGRRIATTDPQDWPETWD